MSHHRHTLRDAIVDAQARQAGWPVPEREVRFDPARRYRFDYAWPAIDPWRHKVALEVQGGIWRKKGGAHTGTGHLRDMEKLNLAQTQGWTVLQLTPQQVGDGELEKWLRKLA